MNRFARGFCAGFGASACFAGLGRQTFRFAFCRNRFAQNGFGLRQAICCGGTAFFCGLDRVGHFGALFGDFLGRRGRIDQLIFGYGATVFQFCATGFGGFQTVPPAGQFLSHLLAAGGACLAFAAQFVERRPARHHRHPCGFDRHFDVFDLGAGGVQIIQITHRTLCFGHLFAGFGGVVFVTGNRHGQAFYAALGHGPVRFGAVQGAGGIGQALFGFATRLARRFIGAVQFGQTVLQRVMGRNRAFRTGGGAGHFLFQRLEAVQLFQTQGGSRWHVFGPSAIAVPTPQVAFKADHALTGFQKRLDAVTIVAVDKADLAHAAGQNIGHRHVLRQRCHARRQRLFGVIGGQNGPARGAVGLDLGCAQIVGQCRTKRLFKTLFHLKTVKDLATFRRVAFQQAGKGRDLGA